MESATHGCRLETVLGTALVYVIMGVVTCCIGAALDPRRNRAPIGSALIWPLALPVMLVAAAILAIQELREMFR